MSQLTPGDREALAAWWHSDWPDDGGEVLDTLAETVERILTARAADPDALAGKVRALAIDLDYAGRPFNHDAEPDPYRRGYGTATCDAAAALRALLDADPVPDARPPLPERVDAVLRRSRNLREGLVEAIQSGELAP